jgi:hypothetical protein
MGKKIIVSERYVKEIKKHLETVRNDLRWLSLGILDISVSDRIDENIRHINNLEKSLEIALKQNVINV